MSFQPGNIVHVEIPAPDLDVAQAFYGRLFGWTFRPFHDRYVFFDAGNIAGALDADKAPSPDGSVVTVQVEDVDAKLAEAAEAGGAVLLARQDLPGDMGSYGYLADPAGNRIGVWTRTA